jgi:hypothetical protein
MKHFMYTYLNVSHALRMVISVLKTYMPVSSTTQADDDSDQTQCIGTILTSPMRY